MVLEAVLNPIFSPFLKIPTLLSVIILSFIISLIVTIIYKYTTDQKLMKQLKEEMKESQKKVKELKHDPEKAMAVQKQAMQTNMKYMMLSMKSTLYSFLPIILIFGWMNANFAFEPIQPGQEFIASLKFAQGTQGSVDISVPSGLSVNDGSVKTIQNDQAAWKLKGGAGEYLIEYQFNEQKYSQEVLISELTYKNPVKKVKSSALQEIKINLQKKIILNLFGWKLGWLLTYLIFAIAFSIGIRKVIKVY